MSQWKREYFLFNAENLYNGYYYQPGDNAKTGDVRISNERLNGIAQKALKALVTPRGELYPFIVVVESRTTGLLDKYETRAYEFFSKTKLIMAASIVEIPGFPAKLGIRAVNSKSNPPVLSSAAALEKVRPYLDESQKAAKAFEEFFSSLQIGYINERAKAKNEYLQKKKTADEAERTASAQLNSALNKRNVSKKGCYIATAVYGSYDCPEVWTLRRFRDFYLAKSVMGQAFIKTYYTVSPAFVRWFGSEAWIRAFCRHCLNLFVKRLKKRGYSDSPYNDAPF